MDRLSQLLRMLETSGEEERSLVDDLTAEERAQMGTLDDWSFKDDVAHYAFWRQRLAENLAAIAEGRPPEWKEWYLEIEERNRMIFDKYQSQSLEEILALSVTALSDLKEAVRGVEHELETVGFIGLLRTPIVPELSTTMSTSTMPSIDPSPSPSPSPSMSPKATLDVVFVSPVDCHAMLKLPSPSLR